MTYHTSLSEVIYYACTSTSSTYTKFELHSFTDSKDMTGAKFKKRVTWLWPRSLGSSLSSKAKHLIYSTCIQNLATMLQSFWRYDCGRQHWKMGHVTLTMPLLGWFVILRLEYVQNLTTLALAVSDISLGLKNLKRITWPWPWPF